MRRILLSTVMVILCGTSAVLAQDSVTPTLRITNSPLPTFLSQDSAFSPLDPIPVREVSPAVSQQDALSAQYNDLETAASRRISELRGEYTSLQDVLADLYDRLRALQGKSDADGSSYYDAVAAIQSQLSKGTTPGNPVLVERLGGAQGNLESLAAAIKGFEDLSLEVAQASSVASFLASSVELSYGISGAVDRDHDNLRQLEDSVSNTLVLVERLLNSLSEDITRTTSYVTAERQNLRTLALAVANGDVYGANISNRLYTQVAQSLFPAAGTASAIGTAAPASTPRPLLVIRFDDRNVAYEQALHNSVTAALEAGVGSTFELVAVDPGTGNAARKAIESAKSKRNAERVLRSLVQLGVNANNVTLSKASRKDATSSEVHVLVR